MAEPSIVLITGASSGIGLHAAKYLASHEQNEFVVYASVRTQTAYDQLFEIDDIHPVFIDVTVDRTIQDAYHLISTQHGQLDGLVNNAGIGPLGYLSSFSEEEMLNLFNVNVFGPWRITNTFLPLLARKKGRVINISSQGGMITKALFGAYSMTKFAIEAYTDALKEEVAPLGISVSTIQPGGIRSEIGEKSFAGNIDRLKQTPPPLNEMATKVLKSFTDPVNSTSSVQDQPESESNRRISEPLITSQAIYHALSSAHPKHRYLVGTHWEGNRVLRALLTKFLDENDNPQHNLNREQIIDLLDSLLEERKLVRKGTQSNNGTT